jgi:outer membrane lipopolysaccharide assembly protein LptE/RlpB
MRLLENATVSILLLTAALLTLIGCGYTTSSLRGERIGKLHVSTFLNETFEQGLDRLVTEAVVDEIIFKGGVKIVKREEAEAELTGSIKDYVLKPLSYNRENEAEEYRLRLSVDVVLTDLATKKIVWQAKGLSAEWTFLHSGPLRQSEEEAKDKAMVYLAREVVQHILEMW